jgi:hypothetical protein
MRTMTAGPWHVNAIKNGRIVGDETAGEFDKLQINAANCTVATVYRAKDARAIAELPKLIEAARVLLAALAWEERRSGLKYSGSDDLRAVLARIEGRSNG